MSAEKRSVHTDALATLGTIIDATAGRDAIHLAVEPVVAAVKLFPGQDVTLTEDGKATSANHSGRQMLGIVDPFLKSPVQPGQMFWLVIYPRQITSLRHVWEHPAFAAGAPVAEPAVDQKAKAEAWLRAFVAASDCPSYEEVIAKALHNNSWSSEYLHFDGQDAHGEIPAEFWDHLETLTGRKFEKSERAEYFSCSC